MGCVSPVFSLGGGLRSKENKCSTAPRHTATTQALYSASVGRGDDDDDDDDDDDADDDDERTAEREGGSDKRKERTMEGV